MKKLLDRVTAVLGSRMCMYGILAFFAFEATWIACSAIYPMAFDEDFHLGIIKIYAQHWSPFLSSQPSDADTFGAVARDPSYLYHYLMSFPYRLAVAMTSNQTVQIVLLRLINVAMFGAGLVLLRQVLLRTRLSVALANTALLLFVLIPIVPQLAGEINYDNLFVPLVAAACLLMFRFMEAVRMRRIDVRSLLLGLSLCLLTCLVKYAFLPMLAGIGMWTVGLLAWHFRHHMRDLGPALANGWRALRWPAQAALVTLALLSVGLFVQRYGVNMVAYKSPVPACDAVLSTDECSAYGPWYRNYLFEQDRDDGAFSHNPLVYTGVWIYWLWYRLFFAINSPTSGYANYPPLLLPSHAAIALGLGALVAVPAMAWRLFRRDAKLVFLLLVSGLYAGVLWAEDFSQYLETGQPVAVNGRYLLPILLLLAPIMGRAFSLALHRWPRLKVALACLALVLFLQGGGVGTFILRSDASWDWHNAHIVMLNNAARRIMSPLTLEGSKYFDGRYWY
jgi:Predicted membrane protein (DUF2142)